MTHLIPVFACWLIGIIGLTMLVRASTWRGKVSAHCAVLLAMFLLSAMALDHDHHQPTQAIVVPKLEPSTHFVALSTSAYHRPGCPMLAREVEFVTSEEAARVRKPCPLCLLSQPKNGPSDSGEHHDHPDTGE